MTEQMAIEEAIKHARKVAEDKRADADFKYRHGRLNSDDYISCAEEHEQLAKWLEELKQYRAIGTVEECRDNNNFLEFLYNHIPPNEMEQYLHMYRTKEKVAVNGYADQGGLMSAT